MRRPLVVSLAVVHILLTCAAIRIISDQADQYNFGRSMHIRRRAGWIYKHRESIQKDPKNTALFIGTSTWHYFLDPTTFDREMKKYGEELTSYNLSIAALVGSSMFSYVGRLGEIFRPENKFKVTFIEMIPIALSREYYIRWGVELETNITGFFATKRTWPQMFWIDPASTMLMWFNSLVRPLNWRLLLNSELEDLPIRIRPFSYQRPEGIAGFWLLPELYEVPEWKIESRGRNTWNFPKGKPLFDEQVANIHELQKWRANIATYVKAHAIDASFSFDRKAIDYFIATVEMAKRFSDRVYVVIFPLSPSLQKKVDWFVDVQSLKARVQSETRVPILDFNSRIRFRNIDYVDAMHPTVEAADQLQGLLAEEVGAELKSVR